MADQPTGNSVSNDTSADAADPLRQPFVEFGATGLKQFSGYVREEWLRDLQGWRGIRVLREMRDNDAVIGAIFFAIEMLLRGVTFNVEPVDTANGDDVGAADFVNSAIADMEHDWPSFLAEVLIFLQYGWSVFELVYKMRRGPGDDPRYNSAYTDGMWGWRKFAGRAQETLLHWEFDESGDPTAMVQLLPTGGPLLRVPLVKCLHFRTTPIKNNPEGRSILRNAYTSHYMKKRILELEAIGIERDLTGLPIAWVPPRLMNKNADPADKEQFAAFKSMVRDTVRNEQEGFVIPLAYDKAGNKIFDFTLLSTGGRRQFDTTQIVDRYDHRITATVLADFIVLGQAGRSGVGSFAQSKNKTDMFGIAVINYLDLITGEFNRKAIPDLLKLNGLPGACKMTHGDIARTDLEELGQFIFQTAQAGALIPDAALEQHLRSEAGLPAMAGAAGTDLNEGGDADSDSDVEAQGGRGENDPARGQGQGRGGLASDGTYDPDPVGGRRVARAKRWLWGRK